MTLFDSYLIVDWSAANKPRRGKDSVWIATWERGANPEPETCNPPTRREAFGQIEAWLHEQAQAKRRVLVGFDFVYGFPRGLSAAMALDGPAPPWRRVWEEIERQVIDDIDDRKNRNNRFEVAAAFNSRIGNPNEPGPFWGCPESKACATLNPRRCVLPYPAGAISLARYRRTECRLQKKGHAPMSAWQLAYVGAVGSQALTGIPHLMRLRDALALTDVSATWPFETGFTLQPGEDRHPLILHAEIWPSLLRWDQSDIKDKWQVRNLLRHFAERDECGVLGTLFAPPAGLSPEEVEVSRHEEGWILGA